MNIKLKMNGKYVVYKEEQIKSMSREELKLLKQEISSNMESVSSAQAYYKANNEEPMNSKNYYQQIAKYKKVFAILKSNMFYVNKVLEDCREDELKQREHWLWCFYWNTQDLMKKRDFEKLVNLTDESAKYHIDVER